MKRAVTIATLALLLAAASVRTPAAVRVLSSARNFGRQFHSLKSAQSIGPIERFVLSLVLAS
jgi:hypothetical protein